MHNLVAVKRTENEYKKYKHFNWFVTKRCNYDCSYCSELLHDKTSERPTLEKLKLGAENIFKQVPPENCFFDFSGGEPSIIPQFIDFIKWLKVEKKIHRVGFITNGTRNYPYFQRLMQWNDHITISYHFEYADDDKLLDKIKKLHNEYGRKIRVQVMYHAVHFERVKRVVAFLKEHNVFYSLREIRVKAASPDFDPAAMAYTNEMVEWLGDNEPKQAKKMLGVTLNEDRKEVEVPSGNYMIYTRLNQFKDWHCWIGLDYFQVWFDGTLNRGSCGVGKPLGNIYESIDWPTDPVVCTKESCFCGPEIFTRKVRSLNHRHWIEDE
jgi:organic radical activating enzyme